MIVEWLLIPIFYLVGLLLSLFPSLDFIAGVAPAITPFFTLLSAVGYFIPLDTFSSVVLVFLAFEFFVFSVSGFNWLFRKIPTIS